MELSPTGTFFGIFTMLYYIACIISGTGVSGVNWSLNIAYRFNLGMNQYFNREMQFNAPEAEQLFIQEQEARKARLDWLKEDARKKSAVKFKLGVCASDIMLFKWYKIAYKSFRIFIRIFQAGNAESAYNAELKRLQQEESCYMENSVIEKCESVFEHSFVVNKRWILDTSIMKRTEQMNAAEGKQLTKAKQKQLLQNPHPSCQSKTVVITHQSTQTQETQPHQEHQQQNDQYEKHISNRCIITCPAIRPIPKLQCNNTDEPNAKKPKFEHHHIKNKGYQELHTAQTHSQNTYKYADCAIIEQQEKFNVYISSTDKSSPNRFVYFLLTDNTDEGIVKSGTQFEKDAAAIIPSSGVNIIKINQPTSRSDMKISQLPYAKDNKKDDTLSLPFSGLIKMLKSPTQAASSTSSKASKFEHPLKVEALLMNKNTPKIRV